MEKFFGGRGVISNIPWKSYKGDKYLTSWNEEERIKEKKKKKGFLEPWVELRETTQSFVCRFYRTVQVHASF